VFISACISPLEISLCFRLKCNVIKNKTALRSNGWYIPLYIYMQYCSMSAESQGALLGISTTGASPQQRWRHATQEKLLEAMFYAWSDTSRRQQMNCCRRCFLWDPLRGFIRRASCGLEFNSRLESSRWAGVELMWFSRETAVDELRPGANSWRKVPAQASRQRSAWDSRQPARKWARK
jgi:hypothetical protein